MPIGDQSDMMVRLKLTLTKRWFADTAPGANTSTPILDGVLSGYAWSWSWLYSLLQYVAQQRRVGTAVGVNLDQIAADFFGPKLRRFPGEGDSQYRTRIKANLLAPKGTRAAVSDALLALTNVAPIIFEPGNATDTGGYGHVGMTKGTGLAYNTAGGWGSRAMPFQAFVRAFRPRGGGVAGVQGYSFQGSGLPAYGGYGVGAIQYASKDMITGMVTDDDIYSAVAGAAPAATILWTSITNQGGVAQPNAPPIGTLRERQASNTLSSLASASGITAMLVSSQGLQALIAAGHASNIAGVLALTSADSTLGGLMFVALVWSNSDMSGMAISNADLTATTSGASQSGIRSTFPRNSGLFYVEVTATTSAATERVGFANGSWLTGSVLGADNNSIGITSSGAIYLNGAQFASGPAWVAGNTVCLAINFNTRTFWYRVNGGPWGSLAAGLTGSQNTGSTDPVISGPASARVDINTTLAITGITASDSIWPHAGNCTLNVNCMSGTLSMTVSGSAVAGSGTNAISYNDTSDNIQAALANLTYSAPASPNADSIEIEIFDQYGNHNTFGIPVTIQGPADPATLSGGYTFSSMAAGPYMMAFGAAASGAVKTINGGASAFAEIVPTGFSPWAAPGGGPPAAPATVTASSETNTSIQLSWTASTG